MFKNNRISPLSVLAKKLVVVGVCQGLETKFFYAVKPLTNGHEDVQLQATDKVSK